MHFRHQTGALIALVASIFVSSGLGAAEQRTQSGVGLPGSWGINVHTLYHAPALKALGAQWVRLTLSWSGVETDRKGHYVWTSADKAVAHYVDNGLHIICILMIDKLHPLYSDQAADSSAVSNALAQWMGAVSAHFKGTGIIWEIGNEPEIGSMGGVWNKPGNYTQLARLAAQAIKRADPTAKVAALSLAWMDRPFASSAIEQGLLADGTIDYLSFHGYHRKTIEPESGLADDVEWLRSKVAAATPGGHNAPEIIDSETGYSIAPFQSAKSINSWRLAVYSEEAQAAYLARHYIEEIFIGIPISIWYKDMHGENAYSLFYDDELSPKGLRPMGKAFRTLATLMPDNPINLKNNIYPVAIQVNSRPNSNGPSRGDPHPMVRSFLRTTPTGGRVLILAAWNAVEAFDGKILDARTFTKTQVLEQWRDVTTEDAIRIPVRMDVAGLDLKKVQSTELIPLQDYQPSGPLSAADVQSTAGEHAISLNVVAGPVPTIVVVSLRK